MFNVIKKSARFVVLSLMIPLTIYSRASFGNTNASLNFPSTDIEVASIDSEKMAKINALLDAIDAKKLVNAIGASAQMQAHQFVPAILSDSLSENKSLTEKQKQNAVDGLQKNAIPRLVENAGKIFFTDSFKQDAINAQKNAYAKFYSTKELKDLTTFYRSSTGKKFIQVQDQVGREIVNGLLQKYMPISIKETRAQADREVSSIKPVVKSTKPVNQIKK